MCATAHTAAATMCAYTMVRRAVITRVTPPISTIATDFAITTDSTIATGSAINASFANSAVGSDIVAWTVDITIGSSVVMGTT